MMTVPFTERRSETWLLERTYHAQLRNGADLSVPGLTLAMKQILDFYVPLPTWTEISREEARATYQQGRPVLLFAENTWEHPKGAARGWGMNRNVHTLLYGKDREQADAVSGTDYAVCFADPQRGTFANAVWKARFSCDTATLFERSASASAIFLGPCLRFPYTTHYTVIAANGQVYEYAGRAEAVQGFESSPPLEVSIEGQVQTIFPQFCYYHEITCPGGIYRLEFFGPRMDEQGYRVKEAEGSGQTRPGQMILTPLASPI